jgi:hypothetical protein
METSLVELSPNQVRMKIKASEPLSLISTPARIRITGIEL